MLRHVIAPVRFFSQISNEILRHPRLSSDAARILTWQLSLPQDADESLSRTAERAGIKKAAFNRAKSQLKEEGYVHEWRQQGLRGLWTTVQLVSSVPLTAEEAATVRDGRPTAVCPAAGQPRGPVAGRHPGKTPEGNTSTPPPPFPPAPIPAVEATPGAEATPDAEAAAQEQSQEQPQTQSQPQPQPQTARETSDEARELLDGITALDPRLTVPRGMLPQLVTLVSQWLTLGHTVDDVRAEIGRSLPGRSQAIHRPGGLLRYVLREPRPVPLPAPHRTPPRVTRMRECAGAHVQPRLFAPAGDEELCAACRQGGTPERDRYTASTARGAAAVRAGLSERPALRR
ncbi:hypothetical protein [Streptomyces sp. PTD5-9]|uniref:hypothetical protein n=1 Tax=Streptomyces sp. PTD5-9 TaxID=3120150 RepID=UPI0030092D3C